MRNKYSKNIILLLTSLALPATINLSANNNNKPLYFCTAANSGYYNALTALIGSIHRAHFNELGEIMVFDIGLSTQNKKKLLSMRKVKIYQIEQKNRYILDNIPYNPSSTLRCDKHVPGSYSFKPVAIKQALDKYPYALWMDAGSIVGRGVEKVFECMWVTGYFLLGGWGVPALNTMNRTLINSLCLTQEQVDLLSHSPHLQSGFIGVTRKVSTQFVLPTYNLAANVRNFIDDGTAKLYGRHDQTVFSAQAVLVGLKIYEHPGNIIEPFPVLNGTCSDYKVDRGDEKLKPTWQQALDQFNILSWRQAIPSDMESYLIKQIKFK